MLFELLYLQPIMTQQDVEALDLDRGIFALTSTTSEFLDKKFAEFLKVHGKNQSFKTSFVQDLY